MSAERTGGSGFRLSVEQTHVCSADITCALSGLRLSIHHTPPVRSLSPVCLADITCALLLRLYDPAPPMKFCFTCAISPACALPPRLYIHSLSSCTLPPLPPLLHALSPLVHFHLSNPFPPMKSFLLVPSPPTCPIYPLRLYAPLAPCISLCHLISVQMSRSRCEEEEECYHRRRRRRVGSGRG